jgi:hypothetical protein
MFNLFQTTPNDAKCKSGHYDHSTKTKKCEHCGKHAKSNSAQECWSCQKKYERRTEKKSNDMRGRVYKTCSKCGQMAKSNRQARCHNFECKQVFIKSEKSKQKKASKKRKKSGKQPAAKKSRLEDQLFFDLDVFNCDEKVSTTLPFRKESSLWVINVDDGQSDSEKIDADLHSSAITSDTTSFDVMTSFVEDTKETPIMERQSSLDIGKAPKLTRNSSIVFAPARYEDSTSKEISEDEIEDLINEYFTNSLEEPEEDKFVFD